MPFKMKSFNKTLTYVYVLYLYVTNIKKWFPIIAFRAGHRGDNMIMSGITPWYNASFGQISK